MFFEATHQLSKFDNDRFVAGHVCYVRRGKDKSKVEDKLISRVVLSFNTNWVRHDDTLRTFWRRWRWRETDEIAA